MFKIWAKIISNDKIKADYVLESEDTFNIHRLQLYMSDICNVFDIETPVIIKKHLEHFYLFNTTTFFPTDFISSVNFDKLVIERIG